MCMASIDKVTHQVIERLYNNGDLDKASLAALRSATNFTSPQATMIWPLIFSSFSEEETKDNEKNNRSKFHNFFGQNGQVSYSEQAIFIALKMYALYQRGIDERNVYEKEDGKDGLTFFQALNRVRQSKSDDEKKSLDRRVNNLFRSTSTEPIFNSLIQLQKLLKSENDTLSIDYVQLARDIYSLQFDYESMRRVVLKWGQEYFYSNVKSKD